MSLKLRTAQSPNVPGKARSQIVKDYLAFPALSALLMAIPDARSRKVDEGRWERAKRRALRRPEPKQRLLRLFPSRRMSAR